ncbi:MAG: hypothetical protein WBP88_08485 [Nitrososphaeraceae archaeon]
MPLAIAYAGTEKNNRTQKQKITIRTMGIRFITEVLLFPARELNVVQQQPS